MNLFPLHALDFYKVGHAPQYPVGTSLIYGNFTPRSSKLAKVLPDFDGKVVNFGLQGFIKEVLIALWNREFFSKPKSEVVARYQRRMDNALGVGAISVDRIEALHDLGYLPIRIKALPEGARVNIKVPLYTIVNTHPDFYWLTNFLETHASANLWKSVTTATTAYEYKRLLTQYAVKTGSPLDFVMWQGHDFSARGQSGMEDAARSGAGHLVSFFGSDTVSSFDYLEDYYGAATTFIGGSVPATEHSVMCAGGSDDELGTIRRIIQDIYPSGVVSVVSDTWDYWDTITTKATALKEVILNRKPDALGLAKTVFRPDSGDPVEVLVGRVYPNYNHADSLDEATEWAMQDLADSSSGIIKITHNNKYYAITYRAIRGEEALDVSEFIPSAQDKGSVETLWDIFGGTITATGHKLLNERVGLIYGDSITLERAQAILAGLEAKGFASANVVFGVGSFTYQHVTRDSFGMATKATYAVVDGIARELFKDPKTDSGTKKSAKGLLRVEKEGSDYVLYDQQPWSQEDKGELKTVFEDGKLVVDQTLEEIRTRLNSN